MVVEELLEGEEVSVSDLKKNKITQSQHLCSFIY